MAATTNFAVEAKQGFRFQPQEFKTIVPGKVFALSGFEFTEFYFIISNNQRELIAIDAL